jgi:hypothetical protein
MRMVTPANQAAFERVHGLSRHAVEQTKLLGFIPSKQTVSEKWPTEKMLFVPACSDRTDLHPELG